jgi:hypothetical protein
VGLLARLRGRRAAPPPSFDPLDPSLEVVVRAPDAARADSAVLAEAAEAGVDVEAPLLVRHLLVGLPDDDAVATARGLLAQDGYALVPGPADAAPVAVWACRTEILTGLSASRERSRMAGLAQRLGGDVAGWEGLRPPVGGPA